MSGFNTIDLIVIIIYLLLMIAIGVYTSKLVKNTADFFIGGRRFGKFLSVMLSFGAGTHSDQAVAVISKTYKVGLSGIWYQWLWLILTPFYWVITPILRRARVVTTADFFKKRFDQSVASLYSFVIVIMMVIDIGTMLLGSGRIVEAISGGSVSFTVAVFGMTAMFLIYGLSGGLVAAAITDSIQGILTVVLSFLLFPFAISKAGGFSGLHEKLSSASTDLFSLVSPGEITVFFIVIVAFNGLVNWPVQPHHLPIASSAKTEMNARIGMTFGNFIKRICTVAWAFTGLAAIALLPNLQNPDHAFGEMTRMLLPTGLVGLLVASVIASVQSSVDAVMVSAAGIFTRNIYYVYITKNKSEKHYLMVGRIASFIVVCLGLAFAFAMPGVIAALELVWEVPSLIGISFWLGLFWRRFNPKAAWASFIFSLIAFVICDWHIFGVDVSLPIEIFSYLIAGFAGGIVTALLTKPQNKEYLDMFYNDIKRPVVDDEKLASDVL